MGNYEKALEYMEEALKIDSRNFRILFNMGVLLNSLNKEEEAKEYYIKSIKENSKYPYSYLNLSIIYKEKKEFETAIDIISEGIDNNPNSSFLYYNRCCFYVNINKLQQAFKDLIRSIELNNIFFEYMKEDEELDKLREIEEYKDYIKRSLQKYK